MLTLSEERERRLVDSARNGNQLAMKQIYDCYSKYLAATCSRFLSDSRDVHDVIQDSFIVIFTSLNKFEYRGSGSLKAWIRQVTVNEALKLLRRHKKTDTIEYKWDLPDNECDDDVTPSFDDVPQSVIQGLIQQLSPGYRTVFNLFVFEEMSHKEIAAKLDITPSTSASQFHRAKSLLAKGIIDYKKSNGLL